MDWERIVLAYASSYAQERCCGEDYPSIDLDEIEPGLWRVLFMPCIVRDDGTTELGMIVVTGEDQLRSLPVVYQAWIKADGDPMLMGWALREETTAGAQ